jgi:hypothetical protein
MSSRNSIALSRQWELRRNGNVAEPTKRNQIAVPHSIRSAFEWFHYRCKSRDQAGVNRQRESDVGEEMRYHGHHVQLKPDAEQD